MFGFGMFLAGFGAGWVSRGTVESSRAAAVKVVAGVMGAVDRVKRAVAMEREHLEDLYAEAQSLFEQKRARSAGVPVEVQAVNDRAA